MHPAMYKAHTDTYEGDIRYRASEQSFLRAYEKPAIEILGQPMEVYSTPYCPFQEIIGIYKPDLEKGEVQDWDWDEDGGGILKQHQGQDSLWGYMSCYGNYLPKQLARFSRHDGLEVDSEFVQTMQQNI